MVQLMDGLSLHDVAEIELFILRRMKEFALGDHASVFRGSGFTAVGIRDWEPGDRMTSIDWVQSSFNNFSPLITRELEQDSTATIVAVADASLSTRCGMEGQLIATTIGRAVTAAGLSALLFQDRFGVVTFDDRFEQLAAARPRTGRSHLLYCLDLYRQSLAGDTKPEGRDVIAAIESQVRKVSFVPVISDFLFPDVRRVMEALARLNAVHDVVLFMADARFTYALPAVSDRWIEVFDVETGQTQVLSRHEASRLAERAAAWQDEAERTAKDMELDVVRVGLDRWEMENAMVAFTAERRLRTLR